MVCRRAGGSLTRSHFAVSWPRQLGKHKCNCNCNVFAASQLSKKLVRKGGKEIAKQCKNKKECVRTSEKFRITRAGKLHCKFVAHLVLNSNNLQEEVPLDLFEVFKAVDELEQQTIAIPAIGTGNEISSVA